MKKILCLMLLSLLVACEDCSKPTRKECVSWYPIIVPVTVGKTIVMQSILTCGKWIDVPNECYKEQSDE